MLTTIATAIAALLIILLASSTIKEDNKTRIDIQTDSIVDTIVIEKDSAYFYIIRKDK